MKVWPKLVFLGCFVLGSALPAWSQTNRSTTVERENGTRSCSSAVDGGSINYECASSGTNPRSGEAFEGSTTGSGTYTPENGYNGSSTSTVNDRVLQRNTQNGATTTTGPNGRTRTRPVLRQR
jgi:hypothetical protein